MMHPTGEIKLPVSLGGTSKTVSIAAVDVPCSLTDEPVFRLLDYESLLMRNGDDEGTEGRPWLQLCPVRRQVVWGRSLVLPLTS